MKDRILQIMDQEGLTPSAFAEAIGIQRAAMSHITKGRNNPSLDVFTKILERFTYINPDWLLHGTGNMQRETKYSVQPQKQLELFPPASHIQPEKKNISEFSKETKKIFPNLPRKQRIKHPKIYLKNKKMSLLYSKKRLSKK